MAIKTTNYEFIKPADNETADITVINENMDLIDWALTPTADPAQVPVSNGPAKLSQWVSWTANRIKTMLGTTNWYDNPPTNLQATANHISAASPHVGHARASDLATHLDDYAKHVTATEKTSWNGKLDATIYTAADVLAKVKTADGADSGLDADLLDGLQASAVQQGARDLTSSLRVQVVLADPAHAQGKVIFNATEGKFKGSNGSAWL